MSTPSSNLDAFMAVMQTAQPSKRERNAECFREAYEVIEQHLARKVSIKVVLETFNDAYGLSVSPARFRQLLAAERKYRQAQDLRMCQSAEQQDSAADKDIDSTLASIGERIDEEARQ